jgi:hypothetical protein
MVGLMALRRLTITIVVRVTPRRWLCLKTCTSYDRPAFFRPFEACDACSPTTDLPSAQKTSPPLAKISLWFIA